MSYQQIFSEEKEDLVSDLEKLVIDSHIISKVHLICYKDYHKEVFLNKPGEVILLSRQSLGSFNISHPGIVKVFSLKGHIITTPSYKILKDFPGVIKTIVLQPNFKTNKDLKTFIESNKNTENVLVLIGQFSSQIISETGVFKI